MFRSAAAAPSALRRLSARGLFGVLLLLARCAAPPAQAQFGHTHHWTAGAVPVRSVFVYHLSGQPVSDTAPAVPCEVLRLQIPASNPTDQDTCDAPGCPYPSGTMIDLKCTVLRWRDYGAPGHFGRWENGKFINEEAIDPEDGVLYGNGTATHYRVSREQPSPSTVKVEPEIDDSGTIQDGGVDVPAYDDPRRWAGFSLFPVRGDRCFLKWGAVMSLDDPCFDVARADDFDLTPLNGSAKLSLPLLSWSFGGLVIPFTVTFNSKSNVDPPMSAYPPPHPAGLSDSPSSPYYNPKSFHNFCQWVEVTLDGEAVWHRGDGSQMAFESDWQNPS